MVRYYNILSLYHKTSKKEQFTSRVSEAEMDDSCFCKFFCPKLFDIILKEFV